MKMEILYPEDIILARLPGKLLPLLSLIYGEEVKLHWANADQYYIKSAEYFVNDSFDLARAKELDDLDDLTKEGLGITDTSLKVHFKIVDASEGEHGNLKAGDATKRFFIIHKENPLDFNENGELVIKFEYRNDPEKSGNDSTWRDKRIAEAVECILSADNEHSKWDVYKRLLMIPAPTEKDKKRPVLAKYINQYTARNTMDYFIHKDLGTFLKRELDFYIKNEVMQLDDIVNADAPAVETYLSKIKVLRMISGKLIDFLAQLENFQKKLRLKKKFVIETNYCLTLDRVPEDLFPAIIDNREQIEEWINLFAIDEIQGDEGLPGMSSPGFSKPLTVEFLQANDKLVLDTKFFDDGFKAKLIASIDKFDEQCDGVLIHSENFQAMRFLSNVYQNQFRCAYIDPPYNTGKDGFSYKDNYLHSSWFSFLFDRVVIANKLLNEYGTLWVSLDDIEAHYFKCLIDQIDGRDHFLMDFIWKKRDGAPNDRTIGSIHEHILSWAISDLSEKVLNLMPRTEKADSKYKVYKEPDGPDIRGPFRKIDTIANGKGGRYVESLYYSVRNPYTGEDVWPRKGTCWRHSKQDMDKLQKDSKLYWGVNGFLKLR